MLQVTFRNMSSTSAVCDLAQQKLAKIENHVRGKPFCSLVLEHRPNHARKDQQYCAHIDLRSPGAYELYATIEAEHPLTAVREVFATLERQLASRHGSIVRATG